MHKRVVIDRSDRDIRVAFLEDQKLVEYHVEDLENKTIVGNVYRGVVQDVVEGLQAAFVDVGLERNVFLHFMDVRPEALIMTADNLDEAIQTASKEVIPGRITRKGRRPRPDPRAHGVAPPLKRGDVIIVQVVKDGIGDKAPRVTSNLSIPGRYLVLLPFPSQDGGVSRRIALGQERFKLKKLLNELRTEDYSFIVRTAGVGAEEEPIRRDVEILLEEWKDLVQSFRKLNKPGLVYSDHDIVNRLVRDAFSPEMDEIVLGDPELLDSLPNTLERQLPELKDKVIRYTAKEPIFEYYNVDSQLAKSLGRKVWLKSGGYLIFDETEALVAIDVNTGRFTGTRDLEKTAFRTNMEACEAVAQQIRLRDAGGIIVIDFIDMQSRDHQNQVNEEFRKHMRLDRAKSTLCKIGDFGLMILTRKRKRMSLIKQIFDECPYCEGEGHILKTAEVWRRIRSDISRLLEKADHYSAVVISCDPTLAEALQDELAPSLHALVEGGDLEIMVRPDKSFHREDYHVTPVEKPTREGVQLPTRRVDEIEAICGPIAHEELPADELLTVIDSVSTSPNVPSRQRSRERPSRPPRQAASKQPSRPEESRQETPEQGAEQPDERKHRARRGRRGKAETPSGEQPRPAPSHSQPQSPQKPEPRLAEAALSAQPAESPEEQQQAPKNAESAANGPLKLKSKLQIVSWKDKQAEKTGQHQKPPEPSLPREPRQPSKSLQIVRPWEANKRPSGDERAQTEAPSPQEVSKSSPQQQAAEPVPAEAPGRTGRKGRRRAARQPEPSPREVAEAAPQLESAKEPAGETPAEDKPKGRRSRKRTSAKRAAKEAAPKEASPAPARKTARKSAKKAAKKSAKKAARKTAAKKAAKRSAKKASKDASS